MNLVNADKLVEWIEKNKNRLHTMEYLDPDDLLFFISDNSIDIDYNATLNTSSCSECANEPTSDWDTGYPCDVCRRKAKDHFQSKADVKSNDQTKEEWESEKIHFKVESKDQFRDVTNMVKSCDICGWFSSSGHPKFFCGYYAEVPLDIKLCKNWIPIKADKVEK